MISGTVNFNLKAIADLFQNTAIRLVTVLTGAYRWGPQNESTSSTG